MTFCLKANCRLVEENMFKEKDKAPGPFHQPRLQNIRRPPQRIDTLATHRQCKAYCDNLGVAHEFRQLRQQ